MKSGYDVLLGMGPLFFDSMIGCMFSTVNAFSVIIASYSAGIDFVDGIFYKISCLILGDILATWYLYYYYLKIKKKKKISYLRFKKRNGRKIFQRWKRKSRVR